MPVCTATLECLSTMAAYYDTCPSLDLVLLSEGISLNSRGTMQNPLAPLFFAYQLALDGDREAGVP
eukprot:3286885-Rhodomonas_salina.1